MSYASLERPDAGAEQPLHSLPLRALQEEAERLGVGDAELDDAEEQAELIALITAAQAAQVDAVEAQQQAAAVAETARRAELRKELQKWKARLGGDGPGAC